jgi:hypothetical protein
MRLSNKELVFFNKEGDALNIHVNETNGLYEGNLLFHENSNGLHKTFGLYTFEKLKGFQYDSEHLYLERFQLFNEHDFNFYGATFINEQIEKIEITNNNNTFYTKWIYGVDFERKFPVGTMIKFNTTFFGFDINNTYSVVSSKKGAIMILSDIDNVYFNTNYLSTVDENTYIGKYISEFNGIGVKSYKDDIWTEYISKWNETNFHNMIHSGRKINVINTLNNDGVYTIEQVFNDKKYYTYVLDNTQYNTTDDLIFNITLMNKVNKIYEGGISISSGSNKIYFTNGVPQLLKPKSKFQLLEGNNTNFQLTVKDIPNFNTVPLGHDFEVDELVMYNNDIYVCIQAFTKDNTSIFSNDYFSKNVNHIYTDEVLNADSLNTSVYLTTDKFTFVNKYNTNNETVLKESVERYKDELALLGLDIKYYNNKLYITTKLPENYATVTYTFGSTVINNNYAIYERIFSTEEKIKDEFNKNHSFNFNKKLTINNIDDRGIELIINENIYSQETEWVYNGNDVDLYRTIDKTLRAWLYKYSAELYFYGINALLSPSIHNNTGYNDTIFFRTVYPNIPMEIDVEIGHYIWEHSDIVVNNIGSEFTLQMYGRNYTVPTIWNGTQDPNINATLQDFYDEHAETLQDMGIHIQNYNNILKIHVDSDHRNLNYKVIVSKNNFVNSISYEIISKYYGNYGSLITSNAIKLRDTAPDRDLFTTHLYSTGQIVSINNTLYPYNNRNYNIIGLDSHTLYLSYEGAYWSLSKARCKLSPFMVNSFTDGFQGDICDFDPESPIFIDGGEFNNDYNYEFNIRYTTFNSYNTGYMPSGNTDLKDLQFVDLNDNIYVLGKDLTVFDSIGKNLIVTILLGELQPLKIAINKKNNYLYALGLNNLYVINPVNNTLIQTITLNGNAVDICINQNSGDMYISYSDITQIDIYNQGNTLALSIVSPIIINPCGKIAYNSVDNTIYVTSQHTVYVFDNIRQLINTYTINETTLNSTIYYSYSINSIFVCSDYLTRIDNSGVFQYPSIPTSVQTISGSDIVWNDIIFHTHSNRVVISQGIIEIGTRALAKLFTINPDNNTIDTNINLFTYEGLVVEGFETGFYGFLGVNEYDRDIYLASQDTKHVLVLDLVNGSVKYNLRLFDLPSKIIYNPNRQSIWGLLPSSNQIFEIEVFVPISIIEEDDVVKYIGENMYGTLHPNYIEPELIWLNTADFIRKPRFNYQQEGENPVQYVWRFREDVEEFFLFDFTGDQLEKDGAYKYTGEKPLPVIYLNDKPNRDLSLVSKPEYQQTIFKEIVHDLDFLDDSDNISFLPDCLETFTAFKANIEGAFINDLILYERENIKFNIVSTDTTYLEFIDNKDINGNSINGIIKLFTSSAANFLTDENGNTTNLRVGQYIKINLTDNNIKKPYISDNNARTFRISQIFPKEIHLEYVDGINLVNEITIIEDYVKLGVKSYLSFTLTTLDLPIARFTLRGQSEEEDIRYKIELNNQGMLLEPKDIFIFKEYDILEGGIDWQFINRKRKELLMIKNDIYPYVGSYKALISAINYFGYNDLKLYEYYHDMDISSEDFGEMKKYEIPNVFTSKNGNWGDLNIFNNINYTPAKLFNLTYNITDFEGNNVSTYSISEVIIKLQGLRKWLREHVMPITHDIHDITGETHVRKDNVMVNMPYLTKTVELNQIISPVTAKLKEAYLQPVNSGSTVYTCKVEFNVLDNKIPDYFTVEVKTYMLYKEWQPYETYHKGDIVSYFGRLFKSYIDNNKIINPLKSDSIEAWVKGTKYDKGALVKYNNRVYNCLVEDINGVISNTPPPISIIDGDELWYDITKWEEIPYQPVQVINEYRTDLHNVLFTIDTNIDPLVRITITTDNGYGQIYSDIKTYEVRSTKNLNAEIKDLDKLEEFKPIEPYV